MIPYERFSSDGLCGPDGGTPLDCVGSLLERPGFVYVSVDTPTSPEDAVSGVLLVDTPLTEKSIEMVKRGQLR